MNLLSDACFNCGQEGHKSFECSEPKKERSSFGGRGGGAGGGGERSSKRRSIPEAFVHVTV